MCYGVLFSFASLPYTSPSPPPESAPELQHEFVSLDGEQKGSQGKIMQVKSYEFSIVDCGKRFLFNLIELLLDSF